MIKCKKKKKKPGRPQESSTSVVQESAPTTNDVITGEAVPEPPEYGVYDLIESNVPSCLESPPAAATSTRVLAYHNEPIEPDPLSSPPSYAESAESRRSQQEEEAHDQREGAQEAHDQREGAQEREQRGATFETPTPTASGISGAGMGGSLVDEAITRAHGPERYRSLLTTTACGGSSGLNEVSTPFQPHFNPISTPFQPHFNPISTPLQAGVGGG